MGTLRAALTLVVITFLAASVQASHPRRALQQARLVRSSCAWPSGGYPRRCSISYASLLAANVTLPSAGAYPARARGYLAAGAAYCSQYQREQCTYPCTWNNAGCIINNQLFYTVWDCPDSLARVVSDCQLPFKNNIAWCNSMPNCSWTPSASGQVLTCMATVLANMSSMQRVSWVGQYFAQIPREVVGCCDGSNHRWLMQKSCQPPDDSQDPAAFCAASPNCRMDDDVGCVPTAQVAATWATQGVGLPLAKSLQSLALECDAITNQAQCDNYKPVLVDTRQMLTLLNQDLDSMNGPITDSLCLPKFWNNPNMSPPIPGLSIM